MSKFKTRDKIFATTGFIFTLICILILFFFLFDIFKDGIGKISLSFLTSLPSRMHEKAGLLVAWTGTLWIFGLTAIIAIPIGVGAGIYLEEYLKKGWLSNILEINISNLAGIPSIIYGILGLGVFVRLMELGNSLMAGALTLALLVLPIIIVSTREAIRAVPKTIKEASYGLGATKWQTIWNQVLPMAKGNIVTGVILAMARAIGETAPLVVVGALAYIDYVASHPFDKFTVLPMQIFNWISRPNKGFTISAAGGIVVLLLIVFLLNGIAIYIRNKARKKLLK